MRPLSLAQITRPLLRETAQDERAAFVAACNVAFASTPNLGGSLRNEIKRTTIKVARSGSSCRILYNEHGQKLHWLLHGTTRQKARPAESITDLDALATKLEAATVAALEAYDREAA